MKSLSSSVPEQETEHPSGLSGFSPRLVAFEQFGRRGIEHVTQQVEGFQRDTIGMAGGVDQPLGGRDGQLAAARLRQRVGRANPFRGHQFGKSESHVEHATNVRTLAARCKSVHTMPYALERTYESVYVGGACLSRCGCSMRRLTPLSEIVPVVVARLLVGPSRPPIRRDMPHAPDVPAPMPSDETPEAAD